ncbi:MAG: DMT family transporter [Pseudomonadota bacterium]
MTQASPALDGTVKHDAERAARLAFVALIAGALAISFSPIFVRVSEPEPTATAFWRVFLALPLLIVWTGGRRGRVTVPRREGLRVRELCLLALPGVAFAGDLFFWHWSIQYTSVANSTLFANLAPIFVVLAAWLLFGQRFSRLFLAGLATAVAGAAMLIGGSLSLGWSHLLGDGMATITALFYAAYILGIGHLSRRYSTRYLMIVSAVVSSLILLPAAILAGESLIPQTVRGWLILLGLAWISQAAGQTLIALGLARLPAAFSSISLLVQPVGAALLAWLLLAEGLALHQIVGGLVVLYGIFLARRGSRPARPRD